MTTTTVEYVYLEDVPFMSIGDLDVVTDEYAGLPAPFLDALTGLLKQQDSAQCARCDEPVGFVLREQPSGFERLEWTATGLARETDSPHVAVLCEQCTPYVPTPEDGTQ